MNTAKTLQLLDVQSNNISPATNIESIYYEVMDGGVIYRNSLYRHFPIYVKYNNNIDDPITVYTEAAGTVAENKIIFRESDTPVEKLIGDTSTHRLTQPDGKDILLSSIRQSHLRNTRYYKLDISTYNFSDIMNLYAPKLWVSNKFDNLDSCIGKITYNSNTILHNYSLDITDEHTAAKYICTTETVGNIEKGTPGIDLTTTDIITDIDNLDIPSKDKHIMTVNEILDKILFKEIKPYIFDASIFMEDTCTSGEIKINNNNITWPNANYKIIANPGKLQIVFNKDENTPLPVDTKLSIKLYKADGQEQGSVTVSKNINYIKEDNEIKFNDCLVYYNDTIKGIVENLYNAINDDDNIKKTPNINYDENDTESLITWNTFEQAVINTIKNIVKDYFSEEELNQFDWKEIIIKKIYTNNTTEYPAKNKTILQSKFQVSEAGTPVYSFESVVGKCFHGDGDFDGILTADVLFKNEYYDILKNTIKIESTTLNKTAEDETADTYKTNFGTHISPEDCSNYIYGIYQIPYNDFYNSSNSRLLEIVKDVNDYNGYKVSTTFELYHKFIIKVPILINSTPIYVTGAKAQYIDFLQDTAQDIVIKIPYFIDGADFEKEQNLPELYAISQGGVFMPANNWEIYSKESDTMYHIYTIKAQNPYDDTELVISNKRTIKIKIYTKYSEYYES